MQEELQVHNSARHSQATKTPTPDLHLWDDLRIPHLQAKPLPSHSHLAFSQIRTNKMTLHKAILQSHALQVAADSHPTRLKLFTPVAPLAQKLKTAKGNKIPFLTYPFPPIITKVA